MDALHEGWRQAVEAARGGAVYRALADAIVADIAAGRLATATPRRSANICVTRHQSATVAKRLQICCDAAGTGDRQCARCSI